MLKRNPIGIYEKAIPNQFDWAQKIQIAKGAGFDFIEISVDESDERLRRLDWSQSQKDQLKDLLKENQFSIRSMCLSGHRRFPFGSKDPDKRQRAYEMMDKAVAFAGEMGIRNIQLAGYDVYYEDSDPSTKAMFLEGLKYASEKAAAANVMLSIEIMDTPFMGTITRCLEYIEAVNSPWLKIYPDLGNLTQWCDEPALELEKGHEHIVAIHLKDTQPGVFKCVPFGEGTVEFRKLFSKLHQLQYRGPFLVEMWADNNKPYTLDESIDEIRAAKLWLQERMGDL